MTSIDLTLGPLRLMSIHGRRKLKPSGLWGCAFCHPWPLALKPSWLWLPESGRETTGPWGPKAFRLRRLTVTLPDSGRNQDGSSSAVQGWNTAGESKREVDLTPIMPMYYCGANLIIIKIFLLRIQIDLL